MDTALRWDDDICDNEVCVGDVGEGEVGGNDVVGKDFDGDGDWQKNFLMTREEMELEWKGDGVRIKRRWS